MKRLGILALACFVLLSCGSTVSATTLTPTQLFAQEAEKFVGTWINEDLENENIIVHKCEIKKKKTRLLVDVWVGGMEEVDHVNKFIIKSKEFKESIEITWNTARGAYKLMLDGDDEGFEKLKITTIYQSYISASTWTRIDYLVKNQE